MSRDGCNPRFDGRPTLGLPSSGRLSQVFDGFVHGLGDVAPSPRCLVKDCDEFIAVYARSQDLPILLANQTLDLAVTGFDYVIESGVLIEQIQDLGYQPSTVQLLGRPDNDTWRSSVRAVASQYPQIARSFLKKNNVLAPVLEIHGAAEVFVTLGIVDFIVDAYMTGETAKANGLVPYAEVIATSGRLFGQKGWRENETRLTPLIQRIAEYSNLNDTPMAHGPEPSISKPMNDA